MPIALVAIQQFSLSVAGFGSQLFDLGINVAIANQDVGPAVVIEVEKSAAPSQILRVHAQSTGESCVVEIGSAAIVVKRRRVSGEVSFHDVEIAVEIVIAGGDAHASLGLAVGAQGATRLDGNVFELSVLLILVEGAGSRVVGYVNVGPSIIVEIGHQHAKPVGGRIGSRDSGGFGNIGERSVSVVVLENVFAAIQAGRTASYTHTF